MVLTNVPNDTKLIKVPAPSFGAKRFLERDLNVADKVLVETGFEPNVSKPEQQDVLDHLFAQVVVNTISLVLAPFLFEGSHHFSARLSVLSEWLFDNDSVDSILGIGILFETGSHSGKDTGGESHVKQSVGLSSTLGLDSLELFCELLETFVRVVGTGNVCGDGCKVFQSFFVFLFSSADASSPGPLM